MTVSLSQQNNNEIRTTRPLSVDEIDRYYKDGFVILPGFFSEEEVAPILQACERDPNICNKQVAFADGKGNLSYMAHWKELDNTLIGVIPRLARLVDAAETLLDGIGCFHGHSKLVKKAPHSQGRFEWHTSFGSAYQKTFVFPDKEIGYFIAITSTNQENGCIKIIKNSHRMGYVHHVLVGDSFMCDPKRMELMVKKHEIIDCEMKPGDAMFMHSNTIHSSQGNQTDRPRIILAGHYGTLDYKPLEGEENFCYEQIKKLPDSWIVDGNYESVFDDSSFIDPQQSFKEIIQSDR